LLLVVCFRYAHAQDKDSLKYLKQHAFADVLDVAIDAHDARSVNITVPSLKDSSSSSAAKPTVLTFQVRVLYKCENTILVAIQGAIVSTPSHNEIFSGIVHHVPNLVLNHLLFSTPDCVLSSSAASET
jgi:hypothetical protein